MKDESFYIDKLELRGIKPTSTRLLILKAMMRGDETISMPEIEKSLVTVDKSTISRTISIFLLHHLIHCIDDGSGSLKYAVCGDDCSCSVDDEHTHFYCEKCKRTFCLKQIHVPVVPLPEGFLLNSVNYVLKGLCPECSEKEAAKKRHN
jgi:Fur family ferric uptake transcriptional regulator